jgi:hypothetical protein
MENILGPSFFGNGGLSRNVRTKTERMEGRHDNKAGRQQDGVRLWTRPEHINPAVRRLHFATYPQASIFFLNSIFYF